MTAADRIATRRWNIAYFCLGVAVGVMVGALLAGMFQ